MWYVYILKSKNFNKSYVGCTNDLHRRLDEHNSGKSFYTKRYAPCKLLKTETFETYKEARSKERFYKSGVGRQSLKELFTT